MYKNNVTFAWEFSWGFWILLHRKVFIIHFFCMSNQMSFIHLHFTPEFSTLILHMNFYIWILHMNFTREFYSWILHPLAKSSFDCTRILHLNFTHEFYTKIKLLTFTPVYFRMIKLMRISIFYIEIFHQQLDFTWAISWEFWIFLYRKVFMTNWISVYKKNLEFLGARLNMYKNI
jgi:hypothetical protein